MIGLVREEWGVARLSGGSYFSAVRLVVVGRLELRENIRRKILTRTTKGAPGT